MGTVIGGSVGLVVIAGGGSGGVSSVNGQTGAAVVDLANVLTHGTTYTAPVEDPNTVTITRTAVNPAASDMWRFTVAGNRGFYINEAAEGRARGQAGDVSFRTQCFHTDDGTTQHIFEVTKSDDTAVFSVDAQGNTTTVGLASGGYTTPADVSSFGTNAGQGTPHFQVTNGPGPGSGYTYLSGQVSISGAITSPAVIATLPAGSRPTATTIVTIRFSGTGAAAALFTINTDGTITCSSNLASTDLINFDSVNFQHA